MTRVGIVVARALVLALLLLSLFGGVASADPGTGGAPPTQSASLPDDPGYRADLFPDDPGFGQ